VLGRVAGGVVRRPPAEPEAGGETAAGQLLDRSELLGEQDRVLRQPTLSTVVISSIRDVRLAAAASAVSGSTLS
jgi:hypothetical protein